MSYGPLVSCVLPTAGRPQFLAQAIRCYEKQVYPHRELVIVHDEGDTWSREHGAQANIRHLSVPRRMPLGAKLNLAIEQARGELIQKLDDDDYYAPAFLETMVQSLVEHDLRCSVAALDCYLVLVAKSGHLTFSGHGWLAGNSLCFHRSLWERKAFRAVERAEDWWFLRDHSTEHVRVCHPGLAIVVRHDLGHTWTHCGTQSVTKRFERAPRYSKALSALVSLDAFEFYSRLRHAESQTP